VSGFLTTSGNGADITDRGESRVKSSKLLQDLRQDLMRYQSD
jgi:hypothetical protein